MKARSITLFGGTLVALLAATSGCGGSDEKVSSKDPYAAEVRQAQQQAKTDFERQVLADGAVTKAEFDEAVQRYVKCAKDRGVEIEPIAVGGYYNYRTVKSDESEAVSTECGTGTTRLIEPLYVDRLMNPEKKDMDELTLACLRKNGVVPDGYTVEQFKKAAEQGFSGAPFDPDGAKFQACMANPSLG
ncbi:hypothetical protein [Actinoplanes teichomyceticus]|uniref:Lipoprotein n=1 Tax=Actinoplanes teichomyceticus TaxID=1867 RepID=A0A561VSZ3_ACTTI|nr:hypothetical protein [Actinoplanes teichomyceticus]TWG14700.1 hypothetical protein FHX34_1041006 [Actinoplanes teichomyceticus]GIF10103.1 hypothetical protein Ate01nite_01350 [Actinoplanes teichomyceticus]